MHDKSYCRVCGYDMQDSIWGEDGKTPSFDICSCCGTEFGYEDFTLESIKLARKHWIYSGCQWNDPNQKSKDWNFNEQLENIPSLQTGQTKFV